MFCNKCGHEFDGNFCPKCGAIAKNAPVKEETTVDFSQDKVEENPYDVYYNEPIYNQKQPVGNTYKVQEGNQAPEQQVENSQNVFEQPQQNPHYGPTPPPPHQPPYSQYRTPYTQAPPPYCPPSQKKTLSWWQILLIVLASIFGATLIFAVIPVSCCICSVATCEELANNNTLITDENMKEQVAYINETVTMGNFSYTLTEVNEVEEFHSAKPQNGYKFIEISIKMTNISNLSQYPDCYSSCYADDQLCNEVTNFDYSYYSGDLMPGKSYVYTATYEIPENANSIYVYVSDVYYDCYDDYYEDYDDYDDYDAELIKFIIQ